MPGRSRASRRRAKSAAISQSASASPGGRSAARTREMRRSELVTVPSFSPQEVAGSSMSANGDVSVSAYASCSTTSSARASPSRTVAWSGIDCAGFVHAIHTILTRARGERVEELDRGEPRLSRERRRRPRAPRPRRDARDRRGRDARTAGWRARPPRDRPSRSAARSARTAPRRACRSAPSQDEG